MTPPAWACRPRANGSAALVLPVTNDPALLGARAYAQWALADSAGQWPGIASFSDGLFVLIGR